MVTILVVILVLCLLGWGGGVARPGLYAGVPWAGNGFGGVGLIIVIILIVLLLRGPLF